LYNRNNSNPEAAFGIWLLQAAHGMIDVQILGGLDEGDQDHLITFVEY
jgi:hypothetical protein